MFTGVVQTVGRIRRIAAGAIEIVYSVPLRSPLSVGASIAANGVCLTATSVLPAGFTADLSEETQHRTAFGAAHAGELVNLELPLRAGETLDGHWVLGHVDAVGRIRALYREREGWMLVIGYPPSYRRYVAEKGSIAVDGVSLTPFDVTEDQFRCAIIPQTYQGTALCERRPGGAVNLEFDILGKYVERMMADVHSD